MHRILRYNLIAIITLLILLIYFGRDGQKLIITRGLPCAGKSTFAKEYIKKKKNFIIIEKDMIRKELFGDHIDQYIFSRQSECLVVHTQFERIIHNLRMGKNVIVANTHLDDRLLGVFKQIASILKVKMIIKDFRNVPLDICIKRDERRKARTMVDVNIGIRELYNKYINGMKI
jgi:predicted kinase